MSDRNISVLLRSLVDAGAEAKALNSIGLKGFLVAESRDVRLQPSEHQIAACQNWRQADDARLWHGHARVFGIGRRERSGLPSTRNGAVICWIGYVLSDRTIGLVA